MRNIKRTHAENWSIGLSTCAFGYLEESVFRAYSENGIGVMEISLSPDLSDALNLKETASFSKKYGIRIRSFHLPFYPFEGNNLASLDPEVRKRTVSEQSERIRRISEAGIPFAVVHPSGEPNPRERRAEMLKACFESLSELSGVAAAAGVTLAVENLPRTCIGNNSEEIKFLLEAGPSLCCCFDTNHLLCEDPLSFIRNVGTRIRAMHVSDYDGIDEKHWLPYEGKTDWISLVNAMEEAGYDGPFLYEVPMKCPKTLCRRDLVPADYVRNYRACVGKRPAEPVGSEPPAQK
ncbi:MAG: sugar phosphate isomerase/epimerase [Clostridia bacterium]|nr:sugar phosphate isomerase/epimerase [Clostridia bacterium]